MDSSGRHVLPHVQYHPTIQRPDAASRDSGVQNRPDHKSRSDLRQKRLPPSGPGPGVGAAHFNQVVRIHSTIKAPGPKAGPHQITRPAPHHPPLRSFSCPAITLSGMKLDQRQVDMVEALTRGQRTNPAWMAWRKNRITASLAHSIAHCRFGNGRINETPPTSYLARITGEGTNRMTEPMKWGVDHEETAIRAYQQTQSQEWNDSFSVEACGLFIDPLSPWLAASPDAIVTDKQNGQRLRVVEVKCPHKHRDHLVAEACQDKDFCLDIKQPLGQPAVFLLKRNHPYFTQVQCQLAVTGLTSADFVVWTRRDLVIVPVTFDPDFWEETLLKLEQFYRHAVLPKLGERAKQASGSVESSTLLLSRLSIN